MRRMAALLGKELAELRQNPTIFMPAVLTGLIAVVLPFFVAIIVPAGVLMGFGFPTGMRRVAAIDRRPTPWFWGINGAAGVLASVAAVAISISAGITATLMLGAICYVLLIPPVFVIGVPSTVREPSLAGPAPMDSDMPRHGSPVMPS